MGNGRRLLRLLCSENQSRVILNWLFIQKNKREIHGFAGLENVHSIAAKPLLFFRNSHRGRTGSQKFSRGTAVLFFNSIFIGAGILGYGYVKLRQHMNFVSPHAVLNSPENCIFFYPADPLEDEHSFLKQHLLPIWPKMMVYSHPTAWALVEETHSDDINVREAAIKKLAELSDLPDSECHQLALNVNHDICVALAHSCADPRLVKAPSLTGNARSQLCFATKFQNILSKLPSNQVHQCLNDYIKNALKIYNPSMKEFDDCIEYSPGFESDIMGFPKKSMSEDQFVFLCLQAVLSHSRITEQIKTLIDSDVLDLLIFVIDKYRHDTDIIILVIKILANLSCDPISIKPIQATGCLRMLSDWSHDEDLKICMPARRALHNLDRDKNTPILPPGIYQVHPDYRTDESEHDYDVVFVHGLLGGAFRTWRRQDEVAPQPEPKKPDPEQENKPEEPVTGPLSMWAQWKNKLFALRSKLPLSYYPKLAGNPDDDLKPRVRKCTPDGRCEYTDEEIIVDPTRIPSDPTQCWPRDWLPHDCPNARILAIDYDSFVTHWWSVCPIECLDRSLYDRSESLLTKLKMAGIGKKPVIWVSHSMGGLLVKNLLCLADASKDEEEKKIAENTKGIIFCSVPHRGSQIAAMNITGKMLLLPTLEVEELSSNSQELSYLQANFAKLQERANYRVINFAESKETVSPLGVKFKLVSFYSADPGFGDFYPLDVDHLNVCKPKSKGSFLYTKIVEILHELSGGPPLYVPRGKPVAEEDLEDYEEDASSQESSSEDPNDTRKRRKRHRDPWRK